MGLYPFYQPVESLAAIGKGLGGGKGHLVACADGPEPNFQFVRSDINAH